MLQIVLINCDCPLKKVLKFPVGHNYYTAVLGEKFFDMLSAVLCRPFVSSAICIQALTKIKPVHLGPGTSG
jgi:hypothetical protein